MAAQVLARRQPQNLVLKPTMSRRREDQDRSDEILMTRLSKRFGEMETLIIPESNLIADGPLTISSAELLGKLPNPDKILKQGIVGKLVSTYEWKPMNLTLTSTALYLSRPGEDVLRDLIPLFEIVGVKKRHEIPGEGNHHLKAEESEIMTGHTSTNCRIVPMSALISEDKALHMIQIRTKDEGYNSGRTYYLQTESESDCSEWSLKLLTEVRGARAQDLFARGVCVCVCVFVGVCVCV